MTPTHSLQNSKVEDPSFEKTSRSQRVGPENTPGMQFLAYKIMVIKVPINHSFVAPETSKSTSTHNLWVISVCVFCLRFS